MKALERKIENLSSELQKLRSKLEEVRITTSDSNCRHVVNILDSSNKIKDLEWTGDELKRNVRRLGDTVITLNRTQTEMCGKLAGLETCYNYPKYEY